MDINSVIDKAVDLVDGFTAGKDVELSPDELDQVREVLQRIYEEQMGL